MTRGEKGVDGSAGRMTAADDVELTGENTDSPGRRLEGPRSDTPGRSQSDPLWPPFPLAKRLNRNALTVAAALAGITVLTVVVVTRPARVPVNAANGVVDTDETGLPVPARPAFLDQPPRESLNSVRNRAAGGSDGSIGTTPNPRRGYADGAPAGLPVPPPLPEDAQPVPSGYTGDREGLAGGTEYASVTTMRPPAGKGPSARSEAYQMALVSSVLVLDRQGGASSFMAATSGVGSPIAATNAGRESPAPEVSAGNDGPNRSPSSLGTKSASDTFEAGAPVSGGSAPESARRRPESASGITVPTDSSGSVFAVRAGTVIPGLLLTGINSDLPGEILGQTSRDVFDSRTERILLIPKGSRLIGSYDNHSANTGRLIVAWTRLILPDGRSLALPHLAAVDERGQVGLHDEVNHHYGRIYGAALLTSVISAGVQLSQPQQSALYAAPSSRQVAAGALGQNLGDVALESAKRGLDNPPTITIRPGQPFNVFVADDIMFDGAYVAQPLLMGR
jgi:type IV secretory pathway VirB10-like protein